KSECFLTLSVRKRTLRLKRGAPRVQGALRAAVRGGRSGSGLGELGDEVVGHGLVVRELGVELPVTARDRAQVGDVTGQLGLRYERLDLAHVTVEHVRRGDAPAPCRQVAHD